MRRHDDALFAGEGRLQALLRSVSDVIVVLDPDGTIRYISPAVEASWGNSVDALVGQNALGRVHPEIRAAEALLRWQRPRRGLLLPADFLSPPRRQG